MSKTYVDFQCVDLQGNVSLPTLRYTDAIPRAGDIIVCNGDAFRVNWVQWNWPHISDPIDSETWVRVDLEYQPTPEE